MTEILAVQIKLFYVCTGGGEMMNGAQKDDNYDNDKQCNKCQRHHHHRRLGTTTHTVLIVHNKTDEHNFKIST